MLEFEVLEILFFISSTILLWNESVLIACFGILLTVYQIYKLVSAGIRAKRIKKMLKGEPNSGIRIRKDASDAEIDAQLKEFTDAIKQAIQKDREDKDGE